MNCIRKVTFYFVLIICLFCCRIGYGENLEYFKYKYLLDEVDSRLIMADEYAKYWSKVRHHKTPAKNKKGTILPYNICSHNPMSMLLIHDQYLPYNNPIVIDIGSGTGGCSRDLAFLGYKVYSIDMDPTHIQMHKENFCRLSGKVSTFVDLLIKIYSLVDAKPNFKKLCNEAKENQKFITGDFTNLKTSEKINQLIKFDFPSTRVRWNVVLALNVFQHMKPKKAEKALNTIKTNLADNGLLIINYTHTTPLRYTNFRILKSNLTSLGFQYNEIKEGNNTQLLIRKRHELWNPKNTIGAG